jgi:hypothetical protein
VNDILLVAVLALVIWVAVLTLAAAHTIRGVNRGEHL